MSDQAAPQFDAALVRRWLGILHGDAPGLLHICSTGDWTGQTFPATHLDAAAAYVTTLNAYGREGIYARVTTLRCPLEPGKRGGAADTLALPALWADLDLAGPGHAELNLPPDEEAGRKVITTSGLPEPTILVHSGGGLYPIWVLDTPHVITDDLADVKDLAAGWQKVIEHAAAQLGWKYGRGVGDLARVLRIPGTVNRKEGLARPCRIISATANRYSIATLYEALAACMAAIPQPVPVSPAPTGSLVPDGVSPGDDYAARTDWADLLTRHGWTLSHYQDQIRYWTRPGKNHGISATTNALDTDRFHVFSTSTVFDAGESYSKFGAYAVLEHHGDHSAAAKALAAAGYGTPLPDPAREQQAAFRDLLGANTQAPEPPPAAAVRPWTPEVDVSNSAVAEMWLRGEIGRGRLAGMFYRHPHIVYTPQEGEDGYVPLRGSQGDNDGPAQVRPVNDSVLASRVQCTYGVYRLAKRGEDWVPVPALFPRPAARPTVDAPDAAPNLRVLRGVVHSPVMRPDGSVLATPGYDPATGLLYLPQKGLVVPPVPEHPTSAQVADAVNLLNYMVSGFSFDSDHGRANYYGLLLTPLLRAMTPPPYKLTAISARERGSGKTLLANIARFIHGGVFRSEMPEDDAELRKQITTILDYTTGPVVIFDNLEGILRSSTLAGLLTNADWDDRKLGVNEMVNAYNDRIWTITGNNVTLGGDLIRRTLWVTIDPGIPDPHLRTGFAIPDLETWARDNRGALIHALLTLVRAWVAAGQPHVMRRSDSYAQWSATVDGILTVAGVPGTFDAPESARQREGADDTEWRNFLIAVNAVMGDRVWLVKELLGYINTGLLIDGGPIPIDALPGDLAAKALMPAGVMGIGRSLGRWLANREGRWVGDLTVRCVSEDRNGVKQWRVEGSGVQS